MRTIDERLKALEKIVTDSFSASPISSISVYINNVSINTRTDSKEKLYIIGVQEEIVRLLTTL